MICIFLWDSPRGFFFWLSNPRHISQGSQAPSRRPSFDPQMGTVFYHGRKKQHWNDSSLDAVYDTQIVFLWIFMWLSGFQNLGFITLWLVGVFWLRLSHLWKPTLPDHDRPRLWEIIFFATIWPRKKKKSGAPAPVPSHQSLNQKSVQSPTRKRFIHQC